MTKMLLVIVIIWVIFVAGIQIAIHAKKIQIWPVAKIMLISLAAAALTTISLFTLVHLF